MQCCHHCCKVLCNFLFNHVVEHVGSYKGLHTGGISPVENRTFINCYKSLATTAGPHSNGPVMFNPAKSSAGYQFSPDDQIQTSVVDSRPRPYQPEPYSSILAPYTHPSTTAMRQHIPYESDTRGQTSPAFTSDPNRGLYATPSRTLNPAVERPRVRETVHHKPPWGAETHDHAHAVILEQATMISVAQYRRVAHDHSVPPGGSHSFADERTGLQYNPGNNDPERRLSITSSNSGTVSPVKMEPRTTPPEIDYSNQRYHPSLDLGNGSPFVRSQFTCFHLSEIISIIFWYTVL